MEVHGFLYETLGPLSTSTITSTTTTNSSDSDPPESYSVFRTQIPSSSSPKSPSPSSPKSPSPSIVALDYFSLDVDADNDINGSLQHSSSPLSPATGSSPVRAMERTLERGWFRANSRFKSPMIQLHKEIIDFCEFLSPTLQEQSSRNKAVECVFDVIKYIWPHCKVEVFGSFKTGLYLPTSDIDVVILDSRVRTPQIGLQALSRALSQRGIAKKMQVIAKARVPIVKFIEKQSGVAFDISFDVQNGPKAAEFIKDAITKIPPLRPLCLILKVFLQQRELNEVYSGGIGSYALLTMLIAQLQMHWKGQYFQGGQASPEQNLGILLVNFFDFYGHKLNIWDVGVSCKGSGTFFLKSNKGFMNKERPYLLSIEDPQAPENDIGRNSFNYSQIRSAFRMAFSTLTTAKTILGLGPDRSILGTIIRPDPLLLERKGGSTGEVTFDSLLPGAGEPVPMQFQDEQDILFNWQLDEDEPLPRGNGTLEKNDVHSSRKRKAFKEKRKSASKENGEVSKGKRKSVLKENGEVVQISHEENRLRKGKGVKKRWKKSQVADGGSDFGRYANGSPWSRSH